VDRAEGLEGEPRVVITFNGKFLPFVEQRVEGNIAQRDK
jgi:cyanate lyase